MIKCRKNYKIRVVVVINKKNCPSGFISRCINEKMIFFLDKVDDMIYLKDESLKYIYANEAHRGTLGIEPSLMLGKRDSDIMPPEEADHCIRSDMAALKDGTYSNEEPIGERWFHVLKHRVELPEENFIGIMGIIRDITKQKLLLSKLNEATYKDFLTGLYNRRYYNEIADKLFNQSRLEGEPMSFILMDIDNFKVINDTFGHLEGDRVLKKLSRVIKSCIRANDLAFRVGGEEFLIILPENGVDIARGVACRIKKELRSDPISIKGITLEFTFSGGIAEVAEGDEKVEDTFKRGDAKLYDAKRAGKDTIRT